VLEVTYTYICHRCGAKFEEHYSNYPNMPAPDYQRPSVAETVKVGVVGGKEKFDARCWTVVDGKLYCWRHEIEIVDTDFEGAAGAVLVELGER